MSSDIPRPHYRNGGAPPPPPPPPPPSRGGSVYARLDRQDEVLAALRATVGWFPDPLSGDGGDGICKYLYELKQERSDKNAAASGVSVFLKSVFGRVVMVATALGFLGGAAAGAVHVAVELHWIK